MTVNVIVSGLPLGGSLCLQVGDVAHGVAAAQVHHAVCSETGFPEGSLLLRSQSRILRFDDCVSSPGNTTAFVCATVRRALPGGKGGFGAQLRGSSSSTRTTNFDACRDLRGRRIGAVRRERAAAAAVAEAAAVAAAATTSDETANHTSIAAGSSSRGTNSMSPQRDHRRSQKRRHGDREEAIGTANDSSRVAAAAAATAAIAEKGYSTANNVATAVADALRSSTPVPNPKRQCTARVNAMSALLDGYDSSSSTSSSDADTCDEAGESPKDLV